MDLTMKASAILFAVGTLSAHASEFKPSKKDNSFLSLFDNGLRGFEVPDGCWGWEDEVSSFIECIDD